MLNYRTLGDKSTIRLDDSNEEITDLFTLTYTSGDFPVSSVEVTEPYIARPDLISLAVYGNDCYADIICKFNGISNPFDLNVGMELFIPSVDFLAELFASSPIISKKAEDSIRIVKSNSIQRKKLNERRSPNEIVEGEENYMVDFGRNMIFY